MPAAGIMTLSNPQNTRVLDAQFVALGLIWLQALSHRFPLIQIVTSLLTLESIGSLSVQRRISMSTGVLWSCFQIPVDPSLLFSGLGNLLLCR